MFGAYNSYNRVVPQLQYPNGLPDYLTYIAAERINAELL